MKQNKTKLKKKNNNNKKTSKLKKALFKKTLAKILQHQTDFSVQNSKFSTFALLCFHN